MKRYFKRGFLIAAMFFVGIAYTGAYFSDSVAVSGNTFTAGTWDVGPEVVINEVYSHAASDETEWIELKNRTASVLSLSGYTIEDNTAKPKDLSSYSIPANGYLVLEQGAANDFSFLLNNDGDKIVLKEGVLVVDQMAYGNYSGGDPVAPDDDETLARIPDGADTDDDAADFSIRSGADITKGDPNV